MRATPGWRAVRALLLLIGCVLLGACGARVLRDPDAVTLEKPLLVAEDEQLVVALDWVVVRNAAGSWAKNADWDEYVLTLRARDAGVTLVWVEIMDSLGQRLPALTTRKELATASVRNTRAYRRRGIPLRPGTGAGTLFAAGGVGIAGAVGVASLTPAVSVGGASTGAGMLAAGAVLGGFVLVGAGVMKVVNNRAVGREIKARHRQLPLVVRADAATRMSFFFPLAPSPQFLTLKYRHGDAEHELTLPLRPLLAGLHLGESKPRRPQRRRGSEIPRDGKR